MHTGGWRTVAYIQEHEFYRLSCLIFGSEMTVIRLCKWYKSLFNTSSHEHWCSCKPPPVARLSEDICRSVSVVSIKWLALPFMFALLLWVAACLLGPSASEYEAAAHVYTNFAETVCLFFLTTRVTTSCNLPSGVFAYYENKEIQIETVSAPETYSVHVLSCSVRDMW